MKNEDCRIMDVAALSLLKIEEDRILGYFKLITFPKDGVAIAKLDRFIILALTWYPL